MSKAKYVIILVLLGLIGLVSAQVDTAWVRRYNGNDSNDYAYALAVDAAGNVYVTGHNHCSGSGIGGYATIKYLPNGDTAWVRTYVGPGNGPDDAATAIAVDGSGNVYVTGYSTGSGAAGMDIATIKYNSAGETLWVRRYNSGDGASDYAYGMALHADTVYVTGWKSYMGPPTYLTVKYLPNGDTAWARTYTGGNMVDISFVIAVDGDGNVCVTGQSMAVGPSGPTNDYATIKYLPNGDTAWVRRYDATVGPPDQEFAHAIAVDGSGNVYVSGWGTHMAQDFDYITIKYLPNGDTAWLRRYDGGLTPQNMSDDAYAIAVDGSGNVFVTGQSYSADGNNDYATVKYNSAGVQQWVSRYDGLGRGEDIANAIAVDGSGNVFVTGQSTGITTAMDYATVKYNSAGVEQWVARYDGPGHGADFGYAIIAVDGTGNVYVTGYSPGFGTGNDYATIKYVPTGAIEENHQPLSADRYSLTAEPNPFTKHTTIRYTIPISGKVSVKLYNATGRLIETLMDEYKNAGSYSLIIDNCKLKISKGVYFLKYESKTNKVEKKLIVQ